MCLFACNACSSGTRGRMGFVCMNVCGLWWKGKQHNIILLAKVRGSTKELDTMNNDYVFPVLEHSICKSWNRT